MTTLPTTVKQEDIVKEIKLQLRNTLKENKNYEAIKSIDVIITNIYNRMHDLYVNIKVTIRLKLTTFILIHTE